MAPGTFGTLLGIPLFLLLQNLSASAYAAAVLALFALGVWICGTAERQLGGHDHRAIVWDEIVGYLVGLWQAPRGLAWIVAGFVLFRLFDIAKPVPIRRAERLPGGWGVMADDALAGVYTFLLMQAGVWYLGIY